MKYKPKFAIWAACSVCVSLCFINACTKQQLPAAGQERPDALAIAVQKEEHVGFINTKGQWQISPHFQQARPFQEGRAAVKENGKWGFIDCDGSYVLDPIYDMAFSFCEGKAPVFMENNGVTEEWFIDTTGHKLFQIELSEGDWYGDFHDGRLRVFQDGYYGFLDETGDVAIPFTYTYAEDSDQGLIKVERDDKYGYVNIDGKEIVPVAYENVGEVSEGKIVAINHEWEKNPQSTVYTVGGMKLFTREGILSDYENGTSEWSERPYSYANELETKEFLDEKGNILFELQLKYGADRFLSNKNCILLEKENEDFMVIDKKGNTVFTVKQIEGMIPEGFKLESMEYGNEFESQYIFVYYKNPTNEEMIFFIINQKGEVMRGPERIKDQHVMGFYEGTVIARAYGLGPDYNIEKFVFYNADGTKHEISTNLYMPDYHHSLWAVEQDGK